MSWRSYGDSQTPRQTPKVLLTSSPVSIADIYLSTAVGGFICLVSQAWVAWLTAILFGTLLLLEVFFLPETLYPRKHILSRLPTEQKSSSYGEIDVVRTKQLPFLNFKKIPGIAHPKPWDAALSFLNLWTFPNVSVTVFFYCFSW